MYTRHMQCIRSALDKVVQLLPSAVVRQSDARDTVSAMGLVQVEIQPDLDAFLRANRWGLRGIWSTVLTRSATKEQTSLKQRQVQKVSFDLIACMCLMAQ